MYSALATRVCPPKAASRSCDERSLFDVLQRDSRAGSPCTPELREK